MNLQETIRRILREETKLSDYIRRRATANDLERLVRDVKISISGGRIKVTPYMTQFKILFRQTENDSKIINGPSITSHH